jgi:flagellar motor switch protein FliN/FliY
MAQDEAPPVDPPPAASDSIPAAAPAAADVAEPNFDTPEAIGAASGGPMLDAAAIEELLKGASFEDPASLAAAASSLADGAANLSALDGDEFKLPNFQQVMQDAQVSSIDLLRDVELNVKIELGRARMLVEDVLKLSEGSVVELDKLAGDPVDVFVNDRLVARGEVLVLNDNFCVRVNEIVAGVKEEG